MRNFRLGWWLIVVLLLIVIGFFWGNHESGTPLAYNVRGSYSVGVQTIHVNQSTPLDITVWYPAERPESADGRIVYNYAGLFDLVGYGLQNAAIDTSNAPYPVVLFSHASGGYRLQSTFLMEHLASYGFIVIAPDHQGDTIKQVLAGIDVTAQIPSSLQQRPADLWMALDTVEAEMGEAMDTDRIILAGHSLGATTSLLMAGATVDVEGLRQWCESSTGYTEICAFDTAEIATIRLPEPDSRVQGVVALAPWNGPAIDVSLLATSSLPVLIMAAEADQVAPVQRDAFPIYAALDPAHSVIVVLGQAGHFVFVDTCPELAEVVDLARYCRDGVWDMQQAHNQIIHYVTAFSLATAYGDIQAQAALNSDMLLRQRVR